MYNHPILLTQMVESKRQELINESNAFRMFNRRKKKMSFVFSHLFLGKNEQSVNLDNSCCASN